jgi:hypothetical protein
MPGPDYHPLYLRGIELFNRRCYFQSHETWEELWIADRGPAHEFYQGLIQAAVALHHLSNGNLSGAKKLLDNSRRHLTPYQPWYLGLDLEHFLARLSECVENPPADLRHGDGGATRPPLPQIRLDTADAGSGGEDSARRRGWHPTPSSDRC